MKWNKQKTKLIFPYPCNRHGHAKVHLAIFTRNQERTLHLWHLMRDHYQLRQWKASHPLVRVACIDTWRVSLTNLHRLHTVTSGIIGTPGKNANNSTFKWSKFILRKKSVINHFLFSETMCATIIGTLTFNVREQPSFDYKTAQSPLLNIDLGWRIQR